MNFSKIFITGMICATAITMFRMGITVNIQTPDRTQIKHVVSFESYGGQNHLVLEQRHSGSLYQYR